MRKEYFMEQALYEARKAYSLKETPIGAVIVYENRIVGRGFNQVELQNNPLAHAEIMAINEAVKELGRWRLYDCQIYITMEPCFMCAGAIANSRIKEVYVGAGHQKNHIVSKHNGFKKEFYKDLNIHFEIGILEEKCSGILVDFFRERRNKLVGDFEK